jgi:hypothetical protein
MINKEVWQCIDGEVFDTFQEAEKHEEEVTQGWMNDMEINPAISLDLLDNEDKDEFFGTMRNMGESVFKAIMDAEYETRVR